MPENGVVAENAPLDTNIVNGTIYESPSNSSVSKPPSKPSSSSSPQAPAPASFPPPKTDKPRPHVCTTCTRSFARLEHLKRHERSHTKEKPFECQACTRCFARRDLLLRHQQKLHSTTTPSSRPRNGRRESATGVTNGRVRKGSVASAANPGMRPRANTLSHIDTSTLGLLSNSNMGRPFLPMHSHHNSFNGISGAPNFGFRAMGSGNHLAMGLPRLETSGLPLELSSGLRTAPPYGGFGAEFDMDMMAFSQTRGNTINPHELHTPGLQGLGIDGSNEFVLNPYSAMCGSQVLIEDDSNFEWMTHGFENQMSFANANEQAIDDSSPSAMSTNSPAAFQDGLHRQHSHANGANPKLEAMWQQTISSQAQMMHSPISMDMNSLFTDMGSTAAENTVSPKSLLARNNSGFDMNFPTPPEMSSVDPNTLTAMSNAGFTLPFKPENFASTASTASIDSSMRQSSVTTNCGELINDHMRNSVVVALSHYTGFGQRRQSVPAVSSPLSPKGSQKSRSFNPNSFPSTQDLQRYTSAYIRYCHPHLPFLHLPTLNFESHEYNTASRQPSTYQAYGQPGMTGGGSCLMLAIAAMGALYENEHSQSKELFEYGKRMISSYLEGRRKSNTNRTPFVTYQQADNEDTPLWLVQAMLLNVVYGHNCGDKTAADIASNQCAALVSLARGAELAKPYTGYIGGVSQHVGSGDAWGMTGFDTNDSDWLEWKVMEERKRTLYAIFVLSSMLVMAYNRAPALTNSEIRLDLPCDEDLWAAENPQTWRALGGAHTANSKSTPFAGALTHLLTAAQRERQMAESQARGDWQRRESQESILKPSSFGCLVLIDALHNYIWETRQRHLGRQWTPQEVEAMHAHIEPALRAWSAAWSSHPMHVIERPNPFGAGPLPADSIPLLDLAYVRLFVDFGRSKEAYWQRDYHGMAQELAKGPETGYVDEATEEPKSRQSPQNGLNHTEVRPILNGATGQDSTMLSQPEGFQVSSRREQHLRKAAFYAADHLINSDRLGLAFAEKTSRELPMQSVLCACDCAQVLSEWVTTLQERAGKHVGILGNTDLPFSELSVLPMLDEEDKTLLKRIEELLLSAEQKVDNVAAIQDARSGGYGSRILMLTSLNMARAAVWPVTKLMAQSLEIQAGYVKSRIEASV